MNTTQNIAETIAINYSQLKAKGYEIKSIDLTFDELQAIPEYSTGKSANVARDEEKEVVYIRLKGTSSFVPLPYNITDPQQEWAIYLESLNFLELRQWKTLNEVLEPKLHKKEEMPDVIERILEILSGRLGDDKNYKIKKLAKDL